jgi:dolichol-phosphate mannosyltransferase
MILWVTFVKLFGYRFGLVVQPGWASTLIAILFLGGIQLIGIGILGEYIGRINDNIKDRPLYVVREVSKELKETNPKTN